MSEFSDGGADAPAAPDAASVSIPDQAPSPSNPLPNQVPPIEKPAPQPKTEKGDKPEAKPEPSKSASDALKRASEALKAKQADQGKPKPEAAPRAAEKAPEAKSEPKVEAKQEQPRGDRGQFAPREGTQPPAERPAPQPSQHRDAPARFDDAAKADWEGTPESVRGAVTRMQREFENGYAKHRESAERFNEVKEFDELARKNGTDLKGTLTKLKEIEDTFERDPIGGFQKVAQQFGYNIRDVAAAILNQSPDQVQSQRDATVSNLERQIEQLKSQIGGVSQTITQQREAEQVNKVTAFAQDNPRFEELAEDIAFFLQSGRASDLSEAYKLAERLNPSDSPPSRSTAAHTGASQQRAQSPVPPALNPAGQKSIAGAPSSGSDPVRSRPVPSSPREAMERAAARLRAQ